MDTSTEATPVTRIGATAGQVWHFLSENGSISFTTLVQRLDLPRDLVMQAVGWLAREDKVAIQESGRTKTISLRHD
jgi:hypothetical protein